MTPTPLGATATRHLMPTFLPSPAAAHGLDMLAAAATATTAAPVLPPASDCISNPAVFGWFPGMSPWPVHSVALQLLPPQQASDKAPHAEICHRYNDGKCKQRHCKYRHACRGYCGPHMLLECPQRQRSSRYWSPRRSAFRGGAPP